MQKKQLKRYLRKAFYTGSFKTIVTALTTIVFLPLIVADLGVERYGLIALTMMFGGAVRMVDFGISKSITLLIGGSNTKDEADTITADGILLTLLVILAILCLATSVLFSGVQIYGQKDQLSISLQNFVFICSFLSLGIMLLNNSWVAILEAKFLVHYVNIGYAISSILLNSFIYAFVLMGVNNYTLVLAPPIALSFTSLYFFVVLYRHGTIKFVRPKFSRAIKMVPVASQFFLLSVVIGVVIPASKYLIVITSSSTASIGIFDIAIKIALLSSSFLNSLSQPLLGVFANFQAFRERVKKIASKICAVLFLMYLCGIVIFLIIGKYIVGFIDINSVNQLYHTSLILIVGLGFVAVSEPFFRALTGLAEIRRAIYSKLVVLLVWPFPYFLLSDIDNLNRVSLSFTIAMIFSAFTAIALGSRIEINKNA